MIHIDTSKLEHFFKQVFTARADEQMRRLSESIKSIGVLEPINIRPINDKDFKYEIDAGHRRTGRIVLAGLKSILCDIRDIDDAATPLLKAEKLL